MKTLNQEAIKQVSGGAGIYTGTPIRTPQPIYPYNNGKTPIYGYRWY